MYSGKPSYLLLNWAARVSGAGRTGSVSAGEGASVADSSICLNTMTVSNTGSSESSSLHNF